jgi:hypothetical protein
MRHEVKPTEQIFKTWGIKFAMQATSYLRRLMGGSKVNPSAAEKVLQRMISRCCVSRRSVHETDGAERFRAGRALGASNGRCTNSSRASSTNASSSLPEGKSPQSLRVRVRGTCTGCIRGGLALNSYSWSCLSSNNS